MKSDPVNLLGLNSTGKPNLVTCTKKFSLFFFFGQEFTLGFLLVKITEILATEILKVN